jgi:hypothetical protein
MKTLNDYPTPETDALKWRWQGLEVEEWRHFVEDKCFGGMDDMERRLTECRHVLSGINSSQVLEPALHDYIKQTLELTKPRP